MKILGFQGRSTGGDDDWVGHGRTSWPEVWKAGCSRVHLEGVERTTCAKTLSGIELVTFRNLKKTNVAWVWWMGVGRRWHKMRRQRWQRLPCAKLWVYPRSPRNMHSSWFFQYSNDVSWFYYSSDCNSQLIDLHFLLSRWILGDRRPRPIHPHLSNTELGTQLPRITQCDWLNWTVGFLLKYPSQRNVLAVYGLGALPRSKRSCLTVGVMCLRAGVPSARGLLTTHSPFFRPQPLWSPLVTQPSPVLQQ